MSDIDISLNQIKLSIGFDSWGFSLLRPNSNLGQMGRILLKSMRVEFWIKVSNKSIFSDFCLKTTSTLWFYTKADGGLYQQKIEAESFEFVVVLGVGKCYIDLDFLPRSFVLLLLIQWAYAGSLKWEFTVVLNRSRIREIGSVYKCIGPNSNMSQMSKILLKSVKVVIVQYMAFMLASTRAGATAQ